MLCMLFENRYPILIVIRWIFSTTNDFSISSCEAIYIGTKFAASIKCVWKLYVYRTSKWFDVLSLKPSTQESRTWLLLHGVCVCVCVGRLEIRSQTKETMKIHVISFNGNKCSHFSHLITFSTRSVRKVPESSLCQMVKGILLTIK